MRQFFIKNALVIIATVGLVALMIIRSLQDFSYPPEHSIPDFPLLAQPDQITCGPTCVAMLLMKYNKAVSLDDVKKETKTEILRWEGQPIGGTTPEYIEVALVHFGVEADLKGATLDRLKYYVSQDRPCIVLVRSGELTWHYVVVVGYDEKNLEIADPAGGQRYKITTQQFMGAWRFETDMDGNEMTGEMADLLLFLMRTSEARSQTLIVPKMDFYR